eukprot:gene38423-50450_t
MAAGRPGAASNMPSPTKAPPAWRPLISEGPRGGGAACNVLGARGLAPYTETRHPAPKAPATMPLSFAFHPRLIDALRGYDKSRWLADVGAGVTVGIVALPLAMAFAIASGLKPEAGLWTAIIAGFLISALGGTNVQIGGPAGAFIVIVYGIVERYGVANLLISTACAGVLLVLLGLFRLGTLVRFVPVSIVIGFTNGIAVLIALSQVKDWLGLSIERMPGNFFSQVGMLAQHLGSFNPYAFGLGAACVAGLFLWPKLTMKESPVMRVLEQHTVRSFARVPAPVVALVTLSLLAWALQLPVETIGSRFGGIPQALPVFALPDFSWETVRLLVTPTLTIALLGVSHIVGHPEILWALSPHHALGFMWANPGTSFIILGAVVLCVTGAEALYADLGHFGKRPIRLAWFSVVMPALTLNYFGQGALLLKNPEAVKNPFYFMAPDWALLPLVLLATMATVIASQALISG